MTVRKRVAKRTNGNMTFSEQKPAYIKDGDRGQEGVSIDDVTIPRIGMLQDLSPQIKKTKPEYIEGAEAGNMFNNVTEEIYGKDIVIIPVMFRKEYIIWRDRDAGGGFRGAFTDMADAKFALGLLEDAGMCEIKDTGQHFVLVVKDDGALEEAVISLSGGTMSASRQLNSLCKIATGDRFARAYKVSSLEVNGTKGDYWSFKFHPMGYVNEDMYNAGEKMYEAVRAGQRDVDRSVPEQEEKTVESAEL